MRPPTYDVAIVGAGMVGAALACALGRCGFRVALLEKQEPKPIESTEYDVRVSAISPATRNILINLGVWDSIRSARVSPYRSMEVWDESGNGRIRFQAADVQRDCLGHIIENRLLQQALWDAVKRMKAVDWYCPMQITNISWRPQFVDIETADRPIRASLVVAADGAQSRLRQQAGIAVQSWDYNQFGIVATVTTEYPHERTAWQRFLQTGPLAFLPLQDGRSSIVWSVQATQAEQLLALPDDVFATHLATAFDHRLGEILKVENRAAFPLHFMQARQLIGARIALVGDAAHVVHPLAGQGVNMGMLDIAELSQCLERAREHGNDLGGVKTLRRYERARKTENWIMGMALDGIKRLFTAQSQSLITLRNQGLNLVNRFDSMKQFFMHRAMGDGAAVPPLAKRIQSIED